MSSLLSKFYELYRTILTGLEQVKNSESKERTVLEVSNSYLNKITQVRQELGSNFKDSVKEKFFYVMIGAYDWIMIQHLSKNFGISSSFFDPYSLEVRCYKTAKFGDKFFTDAREALDKHIDQKELLKVYLNILHILFHRKNRETDNLSRQLTQTIYGTLEYSKKDPCSCERVVNHNGTVFNVNRVAAVVGVLSITYCIASSIIWIKATKPVRDRLHLVQLART